jgi:uncharacterized Zn-finger protein
MFAIKSKFFMFYSCKIFNFFLLLRFAYKHILQEHQNLHYGLKPHTCITCGKKFAARSNLIQHSRRHNFVKDTTIVKDYESDDDKVKINPVTSILKNKRKIEETNPVLLPLCCYVSPKKLAFNGCMMVKNNFLFFKD